MRPLIYYVATSLDGFIAHEDGSFDGFLWDETFIAHILATYPETIPAHLHPKPLTRANNQCFDAVLMGRKTYELGLAAGITNPYPTLDQYVFSRTMQESPDANVALVRANAQDAVRALKQQAGKAVWLCGGAQLAALLWEADLIDRLIVKVNPVLFGTGIPLFAGLRKQSALDLTACNRYESGHVILDYQVQR